MEITTRVRKLLPVSLVVVLLAGCTDPRAEPEEPEAMDEAATLHFEEVETFDAET